METFTYALGAYVGHLHDEVVERYPRMAADVSLCSQAMALLHAVDRADSASGADDNYAAMLSAAEQSVRSATATVHDIGSISVERADHAWFGDALPREATAVVTREMDAWTEQSKATIATKRTKSGTHKRVTKYGRSFADGSTYTREVTQVVPYPLDGALENVKRGPLGADGIALAAIATSAYHLPMVGSEFKSWSEVLPPLVSALLACEPYNYAAHTTGPYIGTNKRQSVAYRSRYGIAYHPRDNDPTGPNVTACDTTARRTVIPAVVKRDADGRIVERQSERTAVKSAPPEHLWVGTKRTPRPPSKNRRTAAPKRTYDEVFIVNTFDPLSSLVYVAQSMEPGRSAIWHDEARTVSGTITRAESKRYSATVHGSDVKAKGARTPSALAKQLAPAF
jgi:hypothetical protein